MLPNTLRADPLADDTIAVVLDAHEDSPWDAIALVNRLIAQWQTNGALAAWRAPDDVPPAVGAALERFLREGARLPDWADAARIERAESVFMDLSMMSCTLLFCASLPECYVIPDLAGVLHVTGQLEAHCDYRIRSTAAMIFPLMMKGGISSSDGGGVAQVLKVRLIHATIRHLILRGNPAHAVIDGLGATIAPLDAPCRHVHDRLHAHGWDVARNGLPCNQEELAYTLLTFHYIYLRGLRRLGLALSAADEEAYLHAWNVAGHLLGIDYALLPHSMAQAQAAFADMQARGRLNPYLPDPRPALGGALIAAIQANLPLRVLKPLPVLLTRYLCGDVARQDLGLDQHVGLLPRCLFAAGMGVTRAIDAVVRLVLPEFSLCRMFTRVVGYQFTVKFLLDQTRPLKLPAVLLNQVDGVVRDWGHDAKAPAWVNALERRLSGRPAARKNEEEQPC